MPQPAQQHARTLDAGSAINCVKYNASGNYILSGGKNRLIDLWNPNTGTHIKSYAGHGYQVLDIDSAGDSRTFVSCGGDRAVFFWDVAGGRTIRRYHGHLQRVNAVAISEDANLIFSGIRNCVYYAPLQSLRHCVYYSPLQSLRHLPKLILKDIFYHSSN